ncbi:hypothetical protein EI534_19605 [Pseudomonas frederiksbergensis]|nr:hypothetical protein [Pseudomonas frederiksbergensis]
MSYENIWFFVDDAPDEAEAFACQIRQFGAIEIEVMSPSKARDVILSGQRTPAGVLMDVDLSASAGEVGTGPGIAQDIRVKQRSKKIFEFPVVRFASFPRVLDNLSGDPSSDDLFDLKIQKEEVAQNVGGIGSRLSGVRSIYDALVNCSERNDCNIEEILKCPADNLVAWGHDGFNSRLMSAFQIAPHVSAGVIIRSFLTPTGLLIDEHVLSIRLGVDVDQSAEAWHELVKRLPFSYAGVGSDNFLRWWARGLEDWWYDLVSSRSALVSLTVAERVQFLQTVLGIEGLVPLQMPVGSPGSRPWRLCALNLEASPARAVPVDPSFGVRLTPRTDLPAWVDPLQVCLKDALQNKNDYRLNRSDLERIPAKVK